MATSFGALCTDFYINHKLAVKMDLPSDRETVLHFFDGVRKRMPGMTRFVRYEGELALESPRREATYQWLAIRRNSIRTGYVNPDTMDDAGDYHSSILEMAPYFLTISPLDVDYFELLFGFDLECKRDHDEVVFDALMENTPFAAIGEIPDAKMLDVQPIFGLSLPGDPRVQAYFEVKTRTKNRRGSDRRYKHEPISLFLTLRRYGPVTGMDELKTVYRELAADAEELATDKLVPSLLTPIARHITTSSG